MLAAEWALQQLWSWYSMKNALLIIFFATSFLTIEAQVKTRRFLPQDSIIELKEYTVYKTDTFNRVDENNLINGKGIWIVNDTNMSMGSSSTFSLTTNGCVHSINNEFNGCAIISNIFYGTFRNNLRIGSWINKWSNNKDRIKLSYNNFGKLIAVNIYHYDGKRAYFTEGKLKDENNISLFYQDGKKIKKYKSTNLYEIQNFFIQE